MKKPLFTLAMIATAICSFAQNEQERSIKMPEVPKLHKFTEFSGIEANPKFETCMQAVEFAKVENVQRPELNQVSSVSKSWTTSPPQYGHFFTDSTLTIGFLHLLFNRRVATLSLEIGNWSLVIPSLQ